MNLEVIKGAKDLKLELESKSQLALALVLLKQIQPLVLEYEAHESKFQASLMKSARSVGADAKEFSLPTAENSII